MTFPFNWTADKLCTEDLRKFELVFSEAVAEMLSCRSVSFLANEPQRKSDKKNDQDNEAGLPQSLEMGAIMVCQQQKPVVDAEQGRLYLPLWQGEVIYGVAAIEGNETTFLKASENWLLDRSRLISRQFELIKQWATDPITGLLNGQYLRRELQVLLEEKLKTMGDDLASANDGVKTEYVRENPNLTIALLEITPKGKDAAHTMQYISRAASCLESIVGRYSPVHYLGAGLFAMLWNGLDVDQAAKMGKTVLRWLRQENYDKSHLGLNTVTLQSKAYSDRGRGKPRDTVDLAMEEAWHALQVARQRGPSALYNSSSLKESPIRHLSAAPDMILKEFSNKWRGRKEFSIVLLQQDNKTEAFSKRLRSLIGQLPLVVTDAGDGYVLHLGKTGRDVLAWVKDLRRRLQQKEGEHAVHDLSFSAGIADYPCLDMSKKNILINARKALIHANFFGNNSEALFDGVSLNISGDIYYNDGDLGMAVKEYRQGLKLEPYNVNLHNSLAVCYAQLKRNDKAIIHFEKALQGEKDNFMALFNLGFAYLQREDSQKAKECFERAYEVDENHFDLILQLGKIYCQTKEYQKAVQILEKIENAGDIAGGRQLNSAGFQEKGLRVRQDTLTLGVLFYRLAQAYSGLKQDRKAIKKLQKAVQYNPNDAASLSLLGELYLRQGEGVEIALSLCKKALDIDDSVGQYWLRYAKALVQNNELKGAEINLKKGLKVDKNNTEMMSLLQAIKLRKDAE